jgi:hypothetical protein
MPTWTAAASWFSWLPWWKADGHPARASAFIVRDLPALVAKTGYAYHTYQL